MLESLRADPVLSELLDVAADVGPHPGHGDYRPDFYTAAVALRYPVMKLGLCPLSSNNSMTPEKHLRNNGLAGLMRPRLPTISPPTRRHRVTSPWRGISWKRSS
jgi:hypothetical protein